MFCPSHRWPRLLQDGAWSARAVGTDGQELAGCCVRPHDARRGCRDRDRRWHDRGLGPAGPQSAARRRGVAGSDRAHLCDSGDGFRDGERPHCLCGPPGRTDVGDPGGHARPRARLLTGRLTSAPIAIVAMLCATTAARSVLWTVSYPLAAAGAERSGAGLGVVMGLLNGVWAADRAGRPAGGWPRSSSCQSAGGLRPDRSGVRGRARRDRSRRRSVPAVRPGRAHRRVGL